MLYGTNASRASGDGGDRDYDPTPIPGLAALGATSPMRRPAVITSGGGYAPQGGGGGGGAAPGETPVNSSRIRSGFSPADRSTSIRFFAAAAKPKARQAFSKSGRGSKESVTSAPPVGLAGLDSWLSDRFKGATRIITPPRVIRNIVPAPIKKIIRYAGAATATVVSGGFIPQPIMRKTFGLSPGESAKSEIALKVTRGITTAVAVVAGAGAMGYGPAAANMAAPSGSAAFPVGTNVTLPMSSASFPGGAGYVGPASSLTPASASFMGPTVPAGWTPGAIGYGAGQTAPAVAGGATKAGLGTQFLQGTGSVLKAVGIQVGAQAIMAGVSKVSSQAAQAAYASDFAPTSETIPSYIYPSNPAGGASGGGGTEYAEGEAPALAGISPLIGIGLVGAAIAVYMSRRKK